MVQYQGGNLKDFQDFVTAIKEQAVLVCCKKNDFNMAKAVYDRVFDGKRYESKTEQQVHEVLQSEDEDHPLVFQHSYSVFQKQAITIMQDIHDQFNTPFLERAAAAILKVRESKTKDVMDDLTSEHGDENINTINQQNLTDLTLSPEAICQTADALGLKNWKPGFQKQQYNGKLAKIREKMRLDEEREVLAKFPETNNSGDVEMEPAETSDRVQQNARPTKTNTDVNRILLDSRHVRTELDDAFSYFRRTAERAYTYRRNINRRDRHQDSEASSDSTSDVSDSGHLPNLGRKPVVRKSLQLSLNTSNAKIKKKAHRIGHRVPWSEKEVRQLKEGVELFGKGSWAKIRDTYKFNGRTSVNLKDKWRNIEAHMNVD